MKGLSRFDRRDCRRAAEAYVRSAVANFSGGYVSERQMRLAIMKVTRVLTELRILKLRGERA